MIIWILCAVCSMAGFYCGFKIGKIEGRDEALEEVGLTGGDYGDY